MDGPPRRADITRTETRGGINSSFFFVGIMSAACCLACLSTALVLSVQPTYLLTDYSLTHTPKFVFLHRY